MVNNCSTIQYQASWGFIREPARPVHLRIDYCEGLKFNDHFDWNNAWHDVIQVNDNVVLLVGPPLYDAKEWITANVSFFDPSGNKLPLQFMELDRVCYTALTTGGQINSISMSSHGGVIQIPVNRNTGAFNNRKTMVVMQKNTPIAWMQQWVLYHMKVHGLDGFLIYDNGSTDYTASALEASLQGTTAEITVVDWPYPFGPLGSDHAPWDSDYGQYIMLEHAKYRYLSGAAIVLNNDTDEFLVTKGITLDQIISHLNNAETGCLRYKGIWIEPYELTNGKSAVDVPVNERDIKNYFCVDPNNHIGIGYKWMVIPSKHLNHQWCLHHVNGPMIESDQLYYAHHLGFNTNWSRQRDVFTGNVSDLKPEPYLLSSLAKMERTP